jgi:predicted nucleotidyltransferase
LLINALEEFGFEEDDLASLREIDFTKHICFSIGEEPLKVDFITRINQVDYDEADKQKNVADIDGLKIPIIRKSDLILSKLNTGKDKDKADVQELQKRTGLDDKS